MDSKDVYNVSVIWDQYWSKTKRFSLDSYMKYFWDEHLEYIIPAIRSFSVKPIIIDVGSGTGILLEMILNSESAIGIGLDTSYNAVRKTRDQLSYLENVNLIIGDVFHLPLREKSQHIALCLGLIEHFKDNITPLLNVFKLVKNNGYAFVSVPQRDSLYAPWKYWQIRKNTWPFGYEREFSISELNNICKEIGFSNFNIVGVDFYPSFLKIVPFEFLFRPFLVILTRYLEYFIKNKKLAHMIMVILRKSTTNNIVK